jgi:hypothetical protein
MSDLKWTILLLNIFLVGCTSIGHVSNKSIIKNDEAIYIIGVNINNDNHYKDATIFVATGELQNNKFSRSLLNIANFAGQPKGGYIIGKARVGETLAIVATLFNYRGYSACGKFKTLVFDLPQNGIHYITDVTYSDIDSFSYRMTFSNDYKQAKHHLKTNYQNIEGNVYDGKYKLLPMNEQCQFN